MFNSNGRVYYNQESILDILEQPTNKHLLLKKVTGHGPNPGSRPVTALGLEQVTNADPKEDALKKLVCIIYRYPPYSRYTFNVDSG